MASRPGALALRVPIEKAVTYASRLTGRMQAADLEDLASEAYLHYYEGFLRTGNDSSVAFARDVIDQVRRRRHTHRGIILERGRRHPGFAAVDAKDMLEALESVDPLFASAVRMVYEGETAERAAHRVGAGAAFMHNFRRSKDFHRVEKLAGVS